MVVVVAALACGTPLGEFNFPEDATLADVRQELLTAAGGSGPDQICKVLAGDFVLEGEDSRLFADAVHAVAEEPQQPVSVTVVVVSKFELSRMWAQTLPLVAVTEKGWGKLYTGDWKLNQIKDVGLHRALEEADCPEEIRERLVQSVTKYSDQEFFDEQMWKLNWVLRLIPGQIDHVEPCHALLVSVAENPSLAGRPNEFGIVLILGRAANLEVLEQGIIEADVH